MKIEVLLFLRLTFKVPFSLIVKDHVQVCLMVKINYVLFVVRTNSAGFSLKRFLYLSRA